MLKDFYQYLLNLSLSTETLKNYKSDLNHFSRWFIQKVRLLGSAVESFSETIPFLSQETAGEYKKFMNKNSIPVKTINRRLSTLRHLSRFLVSSEIIEFDFMKDQTNVAQAQGYSQDAINRFAKFLEREKVSPSTSKNYLSDVRQLFQSIA